MRTSEPIEGLAVLRGRLSSRRAGLLVRVLARVGGFVGRQLAGLTWPVEGAISDVRTGGDAG